MTDGLVVDKEKYQSNRRHMCWVALGLMVVSTIATIVAPARMAQADSILMAQYLALSGLVSAYFLLGSKGSISTEISVKK
jgi:hypothetical protein